MCIASEPSCVLELTVEAFETIRKTFVDANLPNDVTMLET